MGYPIYQTGIRTKKTRLNITAERLSKTDKNPGHELITIIDMIILQQQQQ